MPLSFFPTREVFVSLGPIAVHWYGMMYAFSFLVGLWLFKNLQKYRGLMFSERQLESLLLAMFLGVVLGGRLGYVIFYGGKTYVQEPLEIFAVWHGGMSSHGGFLGVTFALTIFSYIHRISVLRVLDVLVVPIAFGLACGRLGNFINGELYGTTTTLPWAMHFPGADGLRHPTQIYAFLKDLFLLSLAFVLLRKARPLPTGMVTGIFLISYSVLRCFVEYFRDQPFGLVNFLGIDVSRGQILTVPLFVIGIIIVALSQLRFFEARR